MGRGVGKDMFYGCRGGPQGGAKIYKWVERGVRGVRVSEICSGAHRCAGGAETCRGVQRCAGGNRGCQRMQKCVGRYRGVLGVQKRGGCRGVWWSEWMCQGSQSHAVGYKGLLRCAGGIQRCAGGTEVCRGGAEMYS